MDNRWIPVTENLPKLEIEENNGVDEIYKGIWEEWKDYSSKPVLVTYTDGGGYYIGVAYFHNHQGKRSTGEIVNHTRWIQEFWGTAKGFDDWEDNEMADVKVIAWMPLPKPYKIPEYNKKTHYNNFQKRDDAIVEMRKQGKKFKEIAETFNLSEGYVSEIYNREFVRFKDSPCFQLAKEYDISVNVVFRFNYEMKQQYGRTITKEELENEIAQTPDDEFIECSRIGHSISNELIALKRLILEKRNGINI